MIQKPLFAIPVSASPMDFLVPGAVDAASMVPNRATSPPESLEPLAARPGLDLPRVDEPHPPPAAPLEDHCGLDVSAALDKTRLIAAGLYCRGVEATPRPDGRLHPAWAVLGHRCQDGRLSGQSKKNISNESIRSLQRKRTASRVSIGSSPEQIETVAFNYSRK